MTEITNEQRQRAMQIIGTPADLGMNHNASYLILVENVAAALTAPEAK